MKNTVFWSQAPCSLAIVALVMEAARTSETSVNFYLTSPPNIPEDYLHTRQPENPKSHSLTAKEATFNFRDLCCSKGYKL
jgi:hypothetical protein